MSIRTRLMAMGNLVHRRPVAHVKDDIGTVWKSKVTTNDRDRRRFVTEDGSKIRKRLMRRRRQMLWWTLIRRLVRESGEGC